MGMITPFLTILRTHLVSRITDHTKMKDHGQLWQFIPQKQAIFHARKQWFKQNDTAVEFMHDLSQPNETRSYCAMWQRCCRGSRWHCSSMSSKNGRKRKPQGLRNVSVSRLIRGFLEGKRGFTTVLKELHQKKTRKDVRNENPKPTPPGPSESHFPSHKLVFFTGVKMVKWGKLAYPYGPQFPQLMWYGETHQAEATTSLSKCYSFRFPFGMKHRHLKKNTEIAVKDMLEVYLGGSKFD